MKEISDKADLALKTIFEGTRRMEEEGIRVEMDKLVLIVQHYLNPDSMAYLSIDLAVYAYLLQQDENIVNWEKYIGTFYGLEAFDKFRLGFVGRVLKNDPVFMGMVAEKGVLSELEADVAVTNIVRNQDIDVNTRLKALGEFNRIKGRVHKGKRRADEGLVKELEAIDNTGGIMMIDTDMEYYEAIEKYKEKTKEKANNE